MIGAANIAFFFPIVHLFSLTAHNQLFAFFPLSGSTNFKNIFSITSIMEQLLQFIKTYYVGENIMQKSVHLRNTSAAGRGFFMPSWLQLYRLISIYQQKINTALCNGSVVPLQPFT